MQGERDSPQPEQGGDPVTVDYSEPTAGRLRNHPAPDISTETFPSSRRGAIAIRMTLWLGFGVIFGLAPVIVNSLRSGMSAEGLNLTHVLGNGELFIVGAVIAGSAIGELVAAFVEQDFSSKPTTFKVFAIVAGVGTLLLLLANTAGYMVESDPQTVRDASVGFFITTLFPTGAIIGMVARS
ncbi:hypothetical protein [Mycolicibacterium sp.]|uniref:hypothetical protein n=1 Tax=Mycolicibacterium sp. TaxID=2320850 RepID=UPI0037CBB843